MSDGEAKKPFERLPTNVVPVNYALHITPDLQQFTFRGTVNIDVQVCLTKHTDSRDAYCIVDISRGWHSNTFCTPSCNRGQNTSQWPT